MVAGGLTGLSGLQPPEAVIAVPEASAAEVQGGSADPRHALGSLGDVYPWQLTGVPGAYHAPYGTANELLAGPPDAMGAGSPLQDPRADLTPATHAAPYPTLGLRDSVPSDADHGAADLVQLAGIHRSDTGASQEVTYNIDEPRGNWAAIQYDTAGQTLLASGMPRQLMGSIMGRGSTDRVQGMATQNSYGLDGLHEFSRYSQAGVPGNYMWLRPGGRPLVIEAHGNTNTFDGQDSPFAGSGLQKQTRTVRGAALMNQASEYIAPPEPVLAAPLPDDSPVWSSW